jgi:hypothetical protein
MYTVKYSIVYKVGVYKDSRGWVKRVPIHEDGPAWMVRVPNIDISKTDPDCKLEYYEDITEDIKEYFNGDCACTEFPQYFVKQNEGTILSKHPYFNNGNETICKKYRE